MTPEPVRRAHVVWNLETSEIPAGKGRTENPLPKMVSEQAEPV